MADLGEAEAMQAWKEVWSTTQKKSLLCSVKVIRTQIWADLINAGANRENWVGSQIASYWSCGNN